MDVIGEPQSATDISDTGADTTAPVVELTVVVPTFNEADNVPLLVARLDTVLAGIAWEVVFVDDDSPDGTAEVARQIATRDSRVRVLRRVGRRGLSTACVEGVLSSSSPYFAVMDGDLQHDDVILPDMLARLKADNLEIVIGSRYVQGGDSSGLANRNRENISRLGGRAARLVLHAELSDPMSGFFMMARKPFDALIHDLSQQGFKILLDIFASASQPLRFAELPSRFHARQHGESKLDTMAAWEFGVLILDKLIGHYVPVRFAIFGMIGATGLVAHLVTLWLIGLTGAGFTASQISAVLVAIGWNFLFNNIVTYRDQRLRGAALWRGLATFYAISAVGALANIGIAEVVFERGQSWWLAGSAGALIGVVWNFTMSSIYTWRRGNGG
jgi:dolichol-phosphate mannosyltransferase